MLEEEAVEIVTKHITDDMIKSFIYVFNKGLKIYKSCLSGTSQLSDWQQTELVTKFLSASIFTAFEQFDWSIYGFYSENESQSSSRRCYLRSKNLIIDIMGEYPIQRRFVEERIRFNEGDARGNTRYALLVYKISKRREELNRLQIVIPITKNKVITSREIDVS